MIEKTYTCVNRMLYGFMSVAVLGLCGYKLSQWAGDYQTWIALAAALITTLWGGYFLLLRYRLDEVGVTRTLLGSKRIKWQDKVSIQLVELDQGGQAQKKISIEGPDGIKIEMSSDLLSLESMEEIVSDLRAAGLLEG